MDEERAEMKRIKKEKEDKHWANHEAFQIMIHNARKERAEKDGAAADNEDKSDRKETMKEMMARAKAEREAAKKEKEEAEKTKMAEKLEGKYTKEETYEREFFDGVAEKAEQRFKEKQAGVEHAEQVPSKEE